MKVRVKKGCVGWYGEELRNEDDEFELVERTTVSGDKISLEQQFSERWMERLRGRPKKAAKK